MKRPIPGGLLIAVEGIDGAGKTSIATLLAQWCGEHGLGCVISKEPTSLKWGEELRSSAKAGRLTLERELELFEKDRRDHVARTIQPALLEGNIVILDRYYWSSAAYQGARGADYLEVVRNNESFAPKPDVFLLLNIDVDAGLGRIRMRGDQPNLFEAKAALLKAKQIFLQLAEHEPNARVIDSSGHMKETFPPALKALQVAALSKIAACSPGGATIQSEVSEIFGGDVLNDSEKPDPMGTH
jgi:dTMP kinase